MLGEAVIKQRKLLCVPIVVGLVVILCVLGQTRANAKPSGPAALTGQVSSQEEGSMEGVLVSAKKDGSTVTVTVVSDAQGRYAGFSQTKLELPTLRSSHPGRRLRSGRSRSCEYQRLKRRCSSI